MKYLCAGCEVVDDLVYYDPATNCDYCKKCGEYITIRIPLTLKEKEQE